MKLPKESPGSLYSCNMTVYYCALLEILCLVDFYLIVVIHAYWLVNKLWAA
jgi:hypothetical protein